MLDFFGFGGYQTEPEGAYSWQHLLFVIPMILIMIGLSIYFGTKYKNKSAEEKNNILKISAIALIVVEVLRVGIISIRSDDPLSIISMNLPLFLCSIQLIALPVAAFSKGRLKEASLDFVFIFGILGAIFGTIGAAQNYDCYPVLSIENVGQAFTHLIPGFASLFIVISGMASMEKKNIWITFCILFCFCFLAIIANWLLDYNYMFLIRGDGTPYDIAYNLVNGHPILYPAIVIGLFVIYIAVFYYIYFIIKTSIEKIEK